MPLPARPYTPLWAVVLRSLRHGSHPSRGLLHHFLLPRAEMHWCHLTSFISLNHLRFTKLRTRLWRAMVIQRQKTDQLAWLCPRFSQTQNSPHLYTFPQIPLLGKAVWVGFSAYPRRRPPWEPILQLNMSHKLTLVPIQPISSCLVLGIDEEKESTIFFKKCLCTILLLFPRV